MRPATCPTGAPAAERRRLSKKVANARKYGGKKGREGRVGPPVTRHESMERLTTGNRPSLDGLLTSCASSGPTGWAVGNVLEESGRTERWHAALNHAYRHAGTGGEHRDNTCAPMLLLPAPPLGTRRRAPHRCHVKEGTVSIPPRLQLRDLALNSIAVLYP